MSTAALDLPMTRRREALPMPLIAQTSDPTISPWWATAAVPVLLGFWEFLKWGFGEWRKTKAERDSAAATGQAAYILHLEGLVTRQAQALDAKDTAAVQRDLECDKSVQAVSDFRVLTERCLGHCRYLEALLDQHKVSYRHLDPPEIKT